MNIEITNFPSQFDRYNTVPELLEACHAKPYTEYPAPQNRWHVSEADWESHIYQDTSGRDVLVVPDGPWSVAKHPARKKAATEGTVMDLEYPGLIDPARKAAWRDEYNLVTDQGLPVHPLAKLGEPASRL